MAPWHPQKMEYSFLKFSSFFSLKNTLSKNISSFSQSSFTHQKSSRLQILQATKLHYIMNPSSQVADAVWKTIESTRSVTEDQLSILHFLFGKNFERATRIVDQRGVKRISGDPSGRSIFQVVGESRRKEEYLCFAEHYCGCYSFFYDIVNRGEQLCCKHQLAARLAAALGACIDVKVSDEELALLLVKL